MNEGTLHNFKQREIYMLKRRQKRIRLTELANYIGCSQSLLSRYETGECCLSDYKLQKYQSYIDQK